MKITNITSATCLARPRAATPALPQGRFQGLARTELMRTSTTSGLAVIAASGDVAFQGTGVSVATSTAKAIASLPTSAVVVFGDYAGIRSWSPPL